METYLDLAPCIYFSCKEDGTIADVNRRLCEKLGYGREELIGQKLDMICTLATRIFQQTHFFPLLKMQGHAEEIFITLQAKNKEPIPLLINAAGRVADGQQMIRYAGIIVSNRKKFEDELIAAKKMAETALRENTALAEAKEQLQHNMEQLDQQVQLVKKQHAELRQFNKVVTHDLQEPLRKISIFANMLVNEEEAGDQRPVIAKLLIVSEQMRSIVSGLQQYVWITETPARHEKLDLNKIINTARQQLTQDFAAVDLVVKAESIPPVAGDQEQLQLLFYHLLSNVIRFRKPGHQAFAEITATLLMRNHFRNLEGKYRYADFVKLQLKDHGLGFDAAYKDQVFELFKKLHPESGPGVGLSLCRKIIENHQGTVSIDSRPGAGITVTLLLPVEPV
jgi:sigma-B regulation protein RsbU (phosphoserine phosphatase)